MYRRLPHGPHGMGREAVARHQRARLYGAMIEAIDRQGYKATTVAHVIALAGVSRRAFYEQFSNKEDCFLATYDIAVARAKKRMLEGWMGERGWANRVHRACQAFLEDTVKNAKATRLVLIDGLGLGMASHERLLRSAVAFERAVAAGFRAAPDGVPLPPLAPRAIVGGVRYAVFERLRGGREAELPMLTDEILDWVSAYRSPAARIGSGGAVPHLPSEPTRFLEGEDKRKRVLGALVHLTLDQGYRELTDPQLAQFAGMSTESFHKHFPSKRACYLAVVDAFYEETIAVARNAAASANSWEEAAYFALKAGIEHLAAHPGLVQLALVDLFEIGPPVVDSVGATVGRFATLLRESAPEPARAPLLAHETIVGGIWTVLGSYAARKRAKYMPSLTDHLAFILLAPYIGPKAAAHTIDSCRRRLISDARI
jgi:AcrR family transcriptional regulator